MTTGYRAGESIRGEKILCRFGETPPDRSQGLRRLGLLQKHGRAEVLKALKRSATNIPRQVDALECKSARYESDQVKRNGQIHWKGHRAWELVLKGAVWVEIQTPNENVHEAARAAGS